MSTRSCQGAPDATLSPDERSQMIQLRSAATESRFLKHPGTLPRLQSFGYVQSVIVKNSLTFRLTHKGLEAYKLLNVIDGK